jgi:hypothetical protein
MYAVEAVHRNTKWLVQGHNRYWAADTVYAYQNGGDYDFIIDLVKNGSIPTEQRFWDDLFSGLYTNWGLRVYEQDWLFNEFYQYVGEMLESVSLGRHWLLQMNNAAIKNGLTIQYCMPHVRHILQSLEAHAVTQARASDDYKPSQNTEQWRIGGQSILLEALGLAPSKDGFWSTVKQLGNPYGEDMIEPTPRLQAVVVTLSGGPVAVGDGVNFSDLEIIMKTCMKVCQ